MPRKGPRPQPTALKLARGNPGKRALPKGEPEPEAAVPECPPHLGELARVEWWRITAELRTLGLVTRIDLAMLAGYCVTWGRWVEAEGKVEEMGLLIKTPNGHPIQNPYLAIANRALAQLQKLAAEFGLSPSSRTGVKAAGKGKRKPGGMLD